MANTVIGLKNVNLLTKSQYDNIESPALDQLWAVELESDLELKKEITTLVAPNISSETAQSFVSPFTAPSNGWIYITNGGDFNNSQEIKINSQTVGIITGYTDTACFSSVVSEGDVISMNINLGIQTFYPMKGNE